MPSSTLGMGRKLFGGTGISTASWRGVQFDPIAHLKRDSAGLYQLHDDGSEAFIQLRDSFRQIAKERNEDSIDV